jgi:hypothetical protein
MIKASKSEENVDIDVLVKRLKKVSTRVKEFEDRLNTLY